MVCRIGGEEFCIILPESDPHGSCYVAKRLRERVQKTIYLYRDIGISITISIGMSTLLGLNQTIEELIERADSALMFPKQAGRTGSRWDNRSPVLSRVESGHLLTDLP